MNPPERHKDMILNPARWPCWPCLPLKRYVKEHWPELAWLLFYDADCYMFCLGSWLVKAATAPTRLSAEQAAALIDEGWEVD